MSKFAKGSRVCWMIDKEKHFGTVLGAYQAFDDTIEYDILDDTSDGKQEVTVVGESNLKKARISTKSKWVLKTHILEEIHPKDLNKYVRVKVIK